MKKLIFIIIILINSFCYSQSYTEKWNSLSNRYEFFDSNGNMIAYKTYNSLSRQWETYNVKSQSTYQPESSINQPLLERVLTSKQAKYDNNSQRISNLITDTRELLDTSSLDRGLIQTIKNRFNSEYLAPYYRQNYDLSSNSLTQNIIDWLKGGFDKILKEETDKFIASIPIVKDEVLVFKNYYGGYFVPLIEEYTLKNEKWVLTKSEKNNGYVFYDGVVLQFKRGENKWQARDLIFKEHNTTEYSYYYDSSFGVTIINERFKFIIMYNANKELNKKYVYFIGKYDANIRPH